MTPARHLLVSVTLLLVGSGLVEAATPADGQNAGESEQQNDTWWAFRPLVRPAVPLVRGSAATQVRTPIDAILLSDLTRHGLRFSPLASPRLRLRRATSDLLGLPPTRRQRRAHADTSASSVDDWDRLLEELLADPRYGEAWGRDWLDLVRYAETDGFKTDALRPLAYRYRDYVIRAFNEDRSYARFVQEQLAGDELFPESAQAIIATGFNRMWPDESNASNIELARQDALNDLTSNVGSVFLGLSIGCAQCHDHKFDPILQSDFYRLQAHFAGIVLTGSAPIGSPAQLAAYQARLDRWLARSRPLREELKRIEQPARAVAFQEKRNKFPRIVLEAVDTAPEDRSARQHQLAFWSARQLPDDEKKLLARLDEAQKARRAELQAQLKQLEAKRPRPPGQLEAMATLEIASGPPPTHVLDGGNYEVLLEEVQPGTPRLFDALVITPADVPTRRPGSSGRRGALARWLTGPDHPLVARVMVNRIWQGHFGTALVENANDFGRQSAVPRHRRLLDWLAAEFIAGGWSIKHMHRLIMRSWVYQQAGPNGSKGGPIPYASFPRRRLTAERVRDALLAVAGHLDSRMYGPGVRPPLPPKFGTRYTWKASESLSDQSRRSVYIHAKRNLPYPLLRVFDQPDMHESCARRAQTTVAPQALMLLNSELVLGFARGLAERVREATGSDEPAATVRTAWELALGREPVADELQGALEFLKQQRRLDPKRSDAPLVDLCHVLLNTNEFLYVD